MGSFAAWVIPSERGWTVTCSCGYLVTGWPTQAVAQADLQNHSARCHKPSDGRN